MKHGGKIIGLESELMDRLLEYVKIDTQSDKDSATTPSTKKQKDLGKVLLDQLNKIGLTAEMDGYGYVYACLRPNLDGGEVPALGFVAHLDTSPDVSGADVKPQIHRDYRGADLVLEGATIPAKDLEMYVGGTLITSDGTTPLGGDDKAGIAAIVIGIDNIIKSGAKHGDIHVMFIPDEELGADLNKFNPGKFPVKSAYTFDREGNREIDNENFNAAEATITIKGQNAHPGLGGKNIINACLVAKEFDGLIPDTQRPETTNGRDGFYHLSSSNRKVAQATITYDIRDFDQDELNRKIEFLRTIAKTLNEKYRQEIVAVSIEKKYSNMKEGLDKHPEVVGIAVEAAKKAGVNPLISYVRGGIIGANFIERYGIPCPNLFCWQGNPHSKMEFVSVKGMVDASNVLINIVEGHRDYHL